LLTLVLVQHFNQLAGLIRRDVAIAVLKIQDRRLSCLCINGNPRRAATQGRYSVSANLLSSLIVIFTLVLDGKDGDGIERRFKAVQRKIATGAKVDHQFA
jgi:hypothetical protein